MKIYVKKQGALFWCVLFIVLVEGCGESFEWFVLFYECMIHIKTIKKTNLDFVPWLPMLFLGSSQF